MKPHQQRVVDEKTELDDKLGRLKTFITSSPTFTSLDLAEQGRLRIQSEVMALYSSILKERIDNFS